MITILLKVITRLIKADCLDFFSRSLMQVTASLQNFNLMTNVHQVGKTCNLLQIFGTFLSVRGFLRRSGNAGLVLFMCHVISDCYPILPDVFLSKLFIFGGMWLSAKDFKRLSTLLQYLDDVKIWQNAIESLKNFLIACSSMLCH